MRTFDVRENGRRHKKVDSFMTLALLSFTFKRLPPKASSPAYLSRFSEFLALIPIATQSRWEEGWGEGEFNEI
jgi:hypothetical protein